MKRTRFLKHLKQHGFSEATLELEPEEADASPLPVPAEIPSSPAPDASVDGQPPEDASAPPAPGPWLAGAVAMAISSTAVRERLTRRKPAPR